MAKDAYYFSHDSNARNDPRTTALIADYGMDGYGTYWVIIEILSEQDGYRLEKFPKLIEAIAKQCFKQKEAIEALLQALVNDYKLLKEDENYYWSDSLIRRMNEKEEKRQAKVEAGRLGGLKSGLTRSQGKRNEAPLQAEGSTLEANEPKESKAKESKVKEKYLEWVYLTLEEYQRLLNEYGEPATKRMIEILDNYIGQNPKKNNKYTDHNRVIRNWVIQRYEEEQSKKRIAQTEWQDPPH